MRQTLHLDAGGSMPMLMIIISIPSPITGIVSLFNFQNECLECISLFLIVSYEKVWALRADLSPSVYLYMLDLSLNDLSYHGIK